MRAKDAAKGEEAHAQEQENGALAASIVDYKFIH
jgi:hypothetical protein